jgi:very-short-patch-repair endonuclease
LRRAATDAETLLWHALREKIPQYKFRRQHPIGQFVVDIACPARKLAIELDGGQHAERLAADASRSALLLAHHGYRIIRFWNSEVLKNTAGVLETIRSALDE